MPKSLDQTREDHDRPLLSLRERQLHTLFDTTLDAIVIADDHGYYVDVNPAACELFGLTREELLGRSISEFAAPGFNFQAEWQAFQQQETVRGEFQLVRTDGELRMVEYAAAANFLPHRHLSILRDITKQYTARCERQKAEAKVRELTLELDQLRPRPISELEQAQAQLRESQQRLENILNSIEGVVWSIHPETFETIYINSAVEQIFGYSVADFFENSGLWQEIVHPEDQDIITAAFPKLFTQGKTKTKYRIIRADRQVCWVLVRSTLVYDETGKPIRIDGITTDVTEPMQSKQLLEKVTKHLPCTIYQFRQRPDGTFHFPYASAGMEEICGVAPEELQEDASRAFAWIHPDDLSRVSLAIIESAKSLTPWYCEYRSYLPNGQVQWLLGHATPQRELDGSTVWHGSIQDITDQKHIETALVESEAQNRAILQAIPDIIFRVNREGICLSYFNPATASDILGGKNPTGQNMADYLPPELYERNIQKLAIALETRQAQIYEQEVTIAGSCQQEEVRVVPIEDKEEVLFIVRDISEQQAALQKRKQVESENLKTQNFLNSIIENIPNMVFVKDAKDLKFVRFNKAGEELLGYPREALLGKNDYDFFPPEEANFFIAKDQEVLASRTVLDIPEEQIQTNSQGVRTLHTRKIPILDESGNPQYLLGISEDITDLKRSEARLMEVTQLQQAILDGANYTIISTDINGLIKTINAAAQRNLGYLATEVVDQLTPAAFHNLEEIKQRAAELTLELGREIPVGFEVFTAKASLGMIDEYEWSYVRKNGTQFSVQLSITALRDEAGMITGFLGVGRDISEQKTAQRERKQAEAALAESEAQNRAILQAIPDLMFRVDRAGIYLSYSEPTELFHALCNREAVGKPMIDYLPSEVYQSHKYHMELALETGQIQVYEQEVTIAGHCQQEEVRVVPIEDREEVLFIVRDISDRKRAEAELKQQSAELQTTLKKLQNTQAQLIQSEKMSSLGQLVAGIAHEINNPVSFIQGNIKPARDYANSLIELIQLYQIHYPNPPLLIADFIENIDLDYLANDFPKLLESMKFGVTRITDIVKSLRTFSRLDEAGLKAIDLHENIDSTLAVLQNRLNGLGGNPEILLIKNYGDLPLVEAYGGLLNQVFMNLLVNAIDAIEQHQNSLEPEQKCNYKGMITIATSVINSTNQAVISIRDNGSGMSPQVQEKIFNPFFTTKPVGKGTGMGLAISYQIMEEKHQGNIVVNSTPNQGTEFVITLPIKQVSVKIMNQLLISPVDVRSI